MTPTTARPLWKPKPSERLSISTWLPSTLNAKSCGPNVRIHPVSETQEPILATLPLGIQQKQIIVTCNYVARARGVGKLMLVSDALRTCPDLVIRSGEDLTYYRSISDQIYSLLRKPSPASNSDDASQHHPNDPLPLPPHIPIERLGLDELFIDVSGLPFPHTNSPPHTIPPPHFIVKHYPSPSPQVNPSLVHAANWASLIQSRLQSRLSLACSIGVGPSKLGAKLASSFKKPDGLGLVLPDAVPHVLSPMPMGAVPGLGYSARKALVESGLVSSKEATVQQVRDRVGWSEWLAVVGAAVGEVKAKVVWDAVWGIDLTPVNNTSYPTQFSIEDSFRPGSITSRSAFDVATRQLVGLLIGRYRTEGVMHQVMTNKFRLTVRFAGGSWARKSASVAIRVPEAEFVHEAKVVDYVMNKAAMSLADRLVGRGDMDLTLINVAFTHLELKSARRNHPTLDSFFSSAWPVPDTLIPHSSTKLHSASSHVIVMVEDEPPGFVDDNSGMTLPCPMCNESIWPWALEVHLLTHNVSL